MEAMEGILESTWWTHHVDGKGFTPVPYESSISFKNEAMVTIGDDHWVCHKICLWGLFHNRCQRQG